MEKIAQKKHIFRNTLREHKSENPLFKQNPKAKFSKRKKREAIESSSPNRSFANPKKAFEEAMRFSANPMLAKSTPLNKTFLKNRINSSKTRTHTSPKTKTKSKMITEILDGIKQSRGYSTIFKNKLKRNKVNLEDAAT